MFIMTSYLLLLLITADLTITTEKLKEQFASLDPGLVDELGAEYCLPESEVDNIKSSYDSPMQRKEAYLRGGTTGSKGQLISFFAADFRNDFQAFSWRFLNSATSI